MARTNNLTNFLNDVATAIKQKTGNSTPIPASDFDTEILRIETVGTYQTKQLTVATNGNYVVTPDTGYDAISNVNINVSVSPILQNKTIRENGSYTADQNYDGLGTVLVNVPSGSGDVKLFDTVEHMQADQSPSEGDLAVVYREEVQPVTEESEFDSCVFPQTVVLDEAFTGSIYGRFGAVNPIVIFDGTVEMSSSRFRFRGRGESDNINVQYTSSDGITYTRTDGGEELQEFGTTIKWESWGDPFNNIIGNFMKIGGNYFDGLYKYAVGLVDSTKLYWCNVSDCTITWSETRNQVTSFVVNAKTNNYIDGNVLKQLIPDIQALYSATIKNVTFFLNTSDELCFVMTSGGGGENVLAYNKTSGNLPVGIGNVLGSPGREATLYKVNSSLTSFTKIRDISTVSSGAWEYTPLTDIKTIPITVYITGEATSSTRVSTSSNFDTTITNPIDCKSYYNCYLRASTQLNAISDYVYEKTFYGKNGVDIGTLGTTVSTVFNDVSAEIYAKIQNVYDDMTPLVASNNSKMAGLGTYIKLIPSKTDGTPLLDTSNVTNMSSMFYGCSSLTTIPLLDTSNVTNMAYMFYGCSNLTSIPLLDTKKVNTMNNMFYNCESLTTIPLLDASNVTDIGRMFSGCSNLTSIPLLATSNVTNMGSMFAYCESLNNESLNNILAMCANAVKITSNKTLKYIGLTEEQANICKTLSNYSAFITAGWTTGY